MLTCGEATRPRRYQRSRHIQVGRRVRVAVGSGLRSLLLLLCLLILLVRHGVVRGRRDVRVVVGVASEAEQGMSGGARGKTIYGRLASNLWRHRIAFLHLQPSTSLVYGERGTTDHIGVLIFLGFSFGPAVSYGSFSLGIRPISLNRQEGVTS